MEQRSVKLKRSHIALAAILITVGIVAAGGFWHSRARQARREANRVALLHIRDHIALGASHDEVLAAYRQHRTDHLALLADKLSDWIIKMPLEFGATDWHLRIEFQTGRVSSIRVRTSDGPAPKDGPTDKEKGTN